MTLNSRRLNGHVIVETSGQVEAGESCVRFHEFAKQLIASGEHFFVIDMARLSYIDSAGLGLLLSIYATLTLQNGNLKLLNVPDPIREALGITNLTQVFEIFDDESRAVADKGPAADATSGRTA